MTPFYIKTSVCGSSQWKEVSGFYVKRNGEWCEVDEAHVKTDICGSSEWKQYYSNTKYYNFLFFEFRHCKTTFLWCYNSWYYSTNFFNLLFSRFLST